MNEQHGQMWPGAFPDVSGFEPIPIGKIGLYTDEFRQSLPDTGLPNRSPDPSR